MRKVQENQLELKLNGTHQILSYADDVNLLGDNADTINKNTGMLTEANKEIGLEVNVEKAKLSHPALSTVPVPTESGYKNRKQVI
jgi:hypothetical protein